MPGRRVVRPIEDRGLEGFSQWEIDATRSYRMTRPHFTSRPSGAAGTGDPDLRRGPVETEQEARALLIEALEARRRGWLSARLVGGLVVQAPMMASITYVSSRLVRL